MGNNACILRREGFKEVRLPARIYGYLALCEDLKHKKAEIKEKSVVVLGNLPFVSEMTEKSSPEGVRHACWAFLKY
jgi:hypothetical protein